VNGGLNWKLMRRYPFIDWTSLVAGGMAADNVYLFGHLMANGVGDAGSGAWDDEIRPLLVSRDAGTTFSAPHFPSDQNHNNFRRGYPVSSVALEGDRVLALYVQTADAIPDLKSPLGFAIYESEGGRYEKVADVQLPKEMHDVRALSSQMAVDRAGRYRGRLYIAFQAVEAGQFVLALANSDDGGKRWNTHVLHRGGKAVSPTGRLDNSTLASVAVNREGIVGLEWMAPSGCPLFAVSADGGTSFAGSQSLGSCRAEDAAAVTPLATIHCMDTVNSPNVESGDDGARVSTGFSMRVDTNLLWSAQITSDAAGRFHAFWPERQPDGTVAVLTATVTAAPAGTVNISLDHLTEETTQSLVQVAYEKFNPDTATFAIDATVQNVGTEIMSYPTLLEASRDLSDCGRAKYLNTSAVSHRGRPLYKVPKPRYKDSLLPGESTLPVHMEVRVEGCEGSRGSLFDRSRVSTPNRWGFYVLSVGLRVYAAGVQLANP